MSLLIDGYNLLHATDIFGQGGRAGVGGLQRSREALIRFLVASIEPRELPRTTMVFDAAGAPAGLPSRTSHDEMIVLYAVGYPDADSLMEEMIEQTRHARALLVVSSDHRIQRAARRRGARFTDSDLWYAHLCHRRRAIRQVEMEPPMKPSGPLPVSEVDYWLQEFYMGSDDEVVQNEAHVGSESIITDSIPIDPAKHSISYFRFSYSLLGCMLGL